MGDELLLIGGLGVLGEKLKREPRGGWKASREERKVQFEIFRVSLLGRSQEVG